MIIVIAVAVIIVVMVVMMVFVLVGEIGVFYLAGRNGGFQQDGAAVDGDYEKVSEFCGNQERFSCGEQVSFHAGGAVFGELERGFSVNAGVQDKRAELFRVNVKGVAQVYFRYSELVAFVQGSGYFVLICVCMVVGFLERGKVNEIQGFYKGVLAAEVVRAAAIDGKVQSGRLRYFYYLYVFGSMYRAGSNYKKVALMYGFFFKKARHTAVGAGIVQLFCIQRSRVSFSQGHRNGWRPIHHRGIR